MSVGAMIRRYHAGSWCDFIRADLELAWLLVQDHGPAEAIRRLIAEYQWDRAMAVEYAVVAGHWDGAEG